MTWRRRAVATAAVPLLALAALLPAAPAQASASPRIVGGSRAAPGAWPFMAALVSRATPDAFLGQFCGGTLIAPRFVLTAAHCVSSDGEISAAGDLAVKLGTVHLRGRGAVHAIQSVRVDPLYDGDTNRDDVALLKLARPATQRPVVLAGAADASLETPGEPVEVVGWGALGDAGTLYPEALRQAALVLGDPALCGAADAWGAIFDPATMVCAGVPDRSRDSCFGDSGGPLLVGSGAGLRQIGVVSFGQGCARAGTPYGVYARVRGMLDWIAAATGPDPGVGKPEVHQSGRGRLVITARVAPNAEAAFWSATVLRTSGEPRPYLEPTEPLAASARRVRLVAPYLAPGRYDVRITVTTSDGVVTAGAVTHARVRRVR